MSPTDPLALDQLFLLNDSSVGFLEGIDAISNLTDGDINIILNNNQSPSMLDSLDRVKFTILMDHILLTMLVFTCII